MTNKIIYRRVRGHYATITKNGVVIRRWVRPHLRKLKIKARKLNIAVR